MSTTTVRFDEHHSLLLYLVFLSLSLSMIATNAYVNDLRELIVGIVISQCIVSFKCDHTLIDHINQILLALCDFTI